MLVKPSKPLRRGEQGKKLTACDAPTKIADMNVCLQLMVVSLAIALSPPVLAGADIQVNRYSFQKHSAPPHQADLLSAVVETRFPQNVVTVGAAIDYMLERSGYRFIPTEQTAAAMALELPAVHRSIGPLPLRTAISTVAGPAWRLRENSEKRTVWLQRLAGADLSGSGPPASADSSHQEAGSSTDAAAQEVRHSPVTAVSTWLLDPALTLRANLDIWVHQADWTLQWDADHDYIIEHPASYDGNFRHAVETVLEHYRSAPVPLTAEFYTGNAVLLIQPASASR